MTNHPHHFTLNLLQNLIEVAPVTFSKHRKNEMMDIYNKLAEDPATAKDKIENTIVVFGEEIWPYREAYNELYDECGRGQEETLLKSFLPIELIPKYEKFIAEKGNIERLRGQALNLDMYFTSDEQTIIVKAELVAHDKAHKELERLIASDKQDEYFVALEKWKNKQKVIKEALERLRAFAVRSSKWKDEILDKVKTFEQGFGYLERPVTLEDVEGEIEYYGGIVEIGEET